ncbi:MAG TPA: tetratricopeptide repeat protein [Pyrinomonadaceae bacterium]|nr:tetratricopeptide repeat protein [Pyrinomonadaceae bacterium]
MFSIQRFLVCLTFLLALTSGGIAQSKLTAEQWREDLRYFAANMPKTHRNLFHTISREQFEGAVKRLDERIPTMADHEIIVELMRIVAMIGDGHTRLRVHRAFTSVYPVHLYVFKDGLFVQAAAPEYREAVGGRVLKIGNSNVDQALRAVSEIAWRDNEMGIKAHAPRLLVIPEVLHALRIADDLKKVQLVVEKDGRQVTLELKPTGQLQHLLEQRPTNWIDARNSVVQAPLWLRDPRNNFWFQHLTEAEAGCAQGCEKGIAYVQFNAVQDRPQAGEKPGETVEAFFKKVFEYVEVNQIDKFVLDMRLNGGGNNYLNLPLTLGMIKSRVNKRGNLFVIIGRETFSAAQNTVNELEKYTNAIFVGEPTAATPNHFGDARTVELPNSKLGIQASTLWWQDMDPRDTRKWTAPQIAAELTSADYKANVDPAMAAILKFVPGNGLAQQLTGALKSGGFAAASKAYRSFREDPAHVYLETEADVNRLGYEFLRDGKTDDAIEIFKLNVEAHPRSANTYDSLAEAYLRKGNKEEAIKYYSKALEVNPQFASSLEALRQLKQ